MAGIPKRFIRDIIDMTDIISLVEKYVPLKKKGKDHWGLCPFCEDGKNPSFSVSQQKQFYYCFKCRATGNVIGFLESFEGLGFVESVEALASNANLEVPYEKSSRTQEDREPLFKVLASASSFFEDSLADSSIAKRFRAILRTTGIFRVLLVKDLVLGSLLNLGMLCLLICLVKVFQKSFK